MSLRDRLTARLNRFLAPSPEQIQRLMNQLPEFDKRGFLEITRRTAQPGDAVSAERASDVTYLLAVKMPVVGKVLQCRWNPDRGQEVEPGTMAHQAGQVVDPLVREAIIRGSLAESNLAWKGQDPDVQYAIEGNAHLGSVRTTWVPKDKPQGQTR